MEELQQLFIKYNVRTDISFIAKVQTLLSLHNCNYDYIMLLYNNYLWRKNYVNQSRQT